MQECQLAYNDVSLDMLKAGSAVWQGQLKRIIRGMRGKKERERERGGKILNLYRQQITIIPILFIC